MKEHLGDSEASGASSGGICDENRQLYSKCVNKIVNLINEQLRIDAVKFENGGTSFSLVARLVPR
jgi:hypothetical protein